MLHYDKFKHCSNSAIHDWTKHRFKDIEEQLLVKGHLRFDVPEWSIFISTRLVHSHQDLFLRFFKTIVGGLQNESRSSQP